MTTDIWNFCGIRSKPLFCDDCAILDLCAGNNKGIGHWHSRQSLSFANQALKMRNLENRCDKSQFILIRRGKNLLVLFCPRQHIRTYILSLEFGPDLTG